MKTQSILLATISRKNSAVSRPSTLTSHQLKSRAPASFTTPNPSPRSDATLKTVLTSLSNQPFQRQSKSAYRHTDSNPDESGPPPRPPQHQKRSKSVSFVFDKPDSRLHKKSHLIADKQASESVEAPPAKTPKPIIRVQPAYLVSQIEMEEIFSEALKRVEENRTVKASVNDSSLFVDSTLNAVNQESAGNYIASASDSSDNEFESSFYLRPDQEATKSTAKRTGVSRVGKSSAASVGSRPKSSSAQASMYEKPSKLDNWTTEHR